MTFKGRHDMIRKKFDVTSSPTIFYLSSDGKKVDEGQLSAEVMVKEINEVVEKHNRTPKWVEDEESAVATAKEEQKPLVVVYKDDKAKSDQAISEFNVLPLAELYEKIVWVQKKIDLKSDEAKALGITAVPVMWIVDVRVADPQARVLKKVPLPKPGAGIKTDLAAILKTWKGEGKTEDKKE